MSAEDVNELEKIRGALNEIRREGLKAALLHAGIESALVLLASTFLFSRLQLVTGRYTAQLPSSVIGTLNNLFSSLGSSYSLETGMTVGLANSTILAFGVTIVFFSLDLAFTYRLRTVEAFESVNPTVREALRTARDVSIDGETNTMARQLYNDVLERLRDTSSAGFVSGRRLIANLALVLLLGVLVILASTVSFQLGGLGGGALFGGGGGGGSGDAGTQQGGQSTEYTGLQDPNEVLGEESGVGSGSEDLGLQLQTGGSSGSAGGSSGAYADNFEGGASGSVQAQRSGYSSGDRIEDSELVKEYNLRIRGER